MLFGCKTRRCLPLTIKASASSSEKGGYSSSAVSEVAGRFFVDSMVAEMSEGGVGGALCGSGKGATVPLRCLIQRSLQDCHGCCGCCSTI